ncbi:Uncharacterised protein [Nocardia otitidiscaviarum]|uniref:Uncharacterized protein n=1 Tax=Nocardia otitidiscaviarum TaxID=1823 RepID=A0A379JK96_9NOCA|nr:Uncharacterised protein [Nocardia otitidiscaviarum]
MAGKTQTGRASITVASTPAHAMSRVPCASPLFQASSTIWRTCKPISRNTPLSRMNWMVRQLVRSAIREAALCHTGAPWPRIRPQVTTAITPEECTASAGRYAANGASSDRLVSSTGSVMRRRRKASTAAATRPITAPPTAASRKSAPASHRLTAPAMAAMAVRSVTSAVASLNSDSPSSRVTRRRGIPTRRAMAMAATASGGATTAPMATAAANGTGSSTITTTATAKVVNSTNPTDSSVIDTFLGRKSMSEVLIAVVYSSGGSNPSNTSSGSNPTSGTNGRYDATTPATVNTSGSATPIRRANAASATAAAINPTSPNASSTRISCQPRQLLPCSAVACGDGGADDVRSHAHTRSGHRTRVTAVAASPPARSTPPRWTSPTPPKGTQSTRTTATITAWISPPALCSPPARPDTAAHRITRRMTSGFETLPITSPPRQG